MPLKAALVGYGYADKLLRAALTDATPGPCLQVIGSNRSDAIHTKRPDTAVCAPEAAAVYTDVDLVVIAAPNDRHASLAEAVLRTSKHVIVGKPFTVTLVRTWHLARVARDAGRALSVFQSRRWDNGFLAVQVVIEGGALGEAMHVEARFDRYRPQVRTCWREQTGQGTGIWFDLGPHLIDQALQLPSLPDAVNASFACQRPGTETPDRARVVLNVGEHRAVFHVSMLVAGGSPRWIVHGTRNSFVKRRMDQQEAQLLAGIKPDTQGWDVGDDAGVLIDGATSTETRVAASAGDQRAYYVAVRDAVFGQHVNPVPPVQAMSVITVLEAAAAAAETDTATMPGLTNVECADWLTAREAAS